ncbi:hypothetical protein F4778DRAFT_302653 [Xylariomycetidae sp. FL2044]|nr:hypothetical protein F4778DRAFT_302653 [Xylariomycetidae sp. FL2044]
MQISRGRCHPTSNAIRDGPRRLCLDSSSKTISSMPDVQWRNRDLEREQVAGSRACVQQHRASCSSFNCVNKMGTKLPWYPSSEVVRPPQAKRDGAKRGRARQFCLGRAECVHTYIRHLVKRKREREREGGNSRPEIDLAQLLRNDKKSNNTFFLTTVSHPRRSHSDGSPSNTQKSEEWKKGRPTRAINPPVAPFQGGGRPTSEPTHTRRHLL